MTMVRTRLLIDRMKKGETAELLLKGREPLHNVPISIRELGDEVVSIEPKGKPADETGEDQVYRLILKRHRD